jgi:SAM-dependent methyltransferase
MTDLRTWETHAGPALDSAAGFDVIDCGTCGFKHVVPLPSPAELEQLYRHDYYRTDKPLYIAQMQEDLDWWRLVYAERLDAFAALLPPARRRLLDVGSGPGYFLAESVARGWAAIGVEPSKQAAEHSRSLGLDVREVLLSPETAGQLGQFDVIHLSAVLEHIPHPAELLRVAHGLLAPDGLLCVVVPNDYNPVQGALRESCGFAPWWVAPPHHLNYFDFGSLERLFRRTGFNVLSRQTTFPIDLFLLMGDNYVGDATLGRAVHVKRKRLETTLARAGLSGLKQRLYAAMAELGLGREVVLIGRKEAA